MSVFDPTSLERAFELARTGKYSKVSEIVDVLESEHFDITQLEGPLLRKRVRELCDESKKKVGTA